MSSTGITMGVDDQIINFMQSVQPLYWSLMNSLQGQKNLIVQMLISYLLHQETMNPPSRALGTTLYVPHALACFENEIG